MNISERSAEELVEAFYRIQRGREKAGQSAIWRQAEIIFVLYQRSINCQQIAEAISVSRDHVRNIIKTMDIFHDPKTRDPRLSFTHHLTVTIKSKNPLYWLAKAAESKLSVTQLRHVIESEVFYRIRENQIKEEVQQKVDAMTHEAAEMKQMLERLAKENVELRNAAESARGINPVRMAANLADIQSQVSKLIEVTQILAM